MYSKQCTLFAVLVLFIMSAAQAVPGSQDSAADRTKYRSLVREVRSVEAEYTKIQDLAVREVKTNGDATLETKSRLQSLENQRGRIMDRLLLLSLRYGWDIPDRSMPIGESAQPSTEDRDRIFAPADEIIKKRFVEEARKIASRVRLPIISLRTTGQAKSRKAEGGRSND